MRYCDGTYLECQDMWRMSGIQRDVLLYSKPTVCLEDFTVRTWLDGAGGDARLEVEVRLTKAPTGEYADYAVEAMLYDAEGQPMLAAPLRGIPGTATDFCASHAAQDGLVPAADIPSPRRWTAETPYLYTPGADAASTRRAARSISKAAASASGRSKSRTACCCSTASGWSCAAWTATSTIPSAAGR